MSRRTLDKQLVVMAIAGSVDMLPGGQQDAVASAAVVMYIIIYAVYIYPISNVLLFFFLYGVSFSSGSNERQVGASRFSYAAKTHAFFSPLPAVAALSSHTQQRFSDSLDDNEATRDRSSLSETASQ